MVSLTTVILHKDQLELLEQRLKEVRQSNQIVVLDDDSKDQGKLLSLCKKYSAEVVTHTLQNNFSAHRNAVFPRVKGEWTFFLDCDEQVSHTLWRELLTVIASGQFDAVTFSRRDIFLGQKLYFGETGQNSVLRAAKTQLGKGKWVRPIHEVWQVPTQKVRQVSEILWHDSHQTLSGFLQKLNWYASLEPLSREKYSFQRVLFELFTYPLGKFLWSLIGLQGWRDGNYGLIHAFLMSYHSAVTRIYLYEAWYGKKE